MKQALKSGSPPLFLRVTHLRGFPVNYACQSVPADGICLGAEAVALMGGAPRSATPLYMANRHVRIFFSENIWCAQALDCGLHTVINDEIIPPESITPVAPGDVLELGFARLAFLDHETMFEAAPGQPWPEEEPAAEDIAAAGQAWREISALAEQDDVLRRLGHEGLRVLDNPETLSRPAWSEASGPRPERGPGGDSGKNLWQLCGSPESDGKNLTDFVMGEISIDDVLAGLGEEAALAEPEAPEDPLELLGPLEAGTAREKRAGNARRAGAGAERRSMTLDSHYAPGAD